MRCRRALGPVLAIVVATLAACSDGGLNVMSDTADSSSPTSTSTPIDGERFTDPEDSYAITIDPEWIPQHGTIAEGIEVWFVAERENGFTANVNVLTQLAPGADLSDYLELSRENAAGFDVIDERIVNGVHGELGVLEYSGAQAGQSLRFIAVVAVHSGRAIVATLTARTESFERLREEIEPYLLTLEAL